jgi:two-component system sensor kinase FixL
MVARAPAGRVDIRQEAGRAALRHGLEIAPGLGTLQSVKPLARKGRTSRVSPLAGVPARDTGRVARTRRRRRSAGPIGGRNAADALRRVQERLQVALEASGGVTWAWDVCDDRVEWIPEHDRLYGRGSEPLDSIEAWIARVHPEDRTRLAARLRKILYTAGEDVWDEEFRIQHPQLGVRWIGALGRAFRDASGRAVRVAGVNFDVTERHRAEAALLRSERRFRKIYENVVTGIAIMDWRGRIRECNLACCRLLGYSEAELRELDFSRLLHPDDLPAKLEALRRLRSGEAPHYDFECRYVRKDGEPVWVQTFASTLPEDSGEPAHVVMLLTNRDARRRVENALRESEARVRQLNAELADRVAERTAQWQDQHARLQAIVDTAAEGVITIDAQGIVDSVNAAALRIFGYAADEVLGHNVNLLVASPHDAAHDSYLRHYLATGERMAPGLARAVTGRDRQGRSIPLEISLSEIDTGGTRRFVAVLRDVSVQRRLEAQLRERLEDAAQLQRLGTAGELAGVLAHQLNQPLAAILGFAEAGAARLRRGKAAPERMAQAFTEIAEQAHRAAGVIADLRRFLSRETGDAVPGDLNDIARRAIELVGVAARDAGIVLTLDLPASLPAVAMRQSQIEQVLLILLDNASDAILGAPPAPAAPYPRGTIEVRTALAEDGSFAVLSVRDSGPGLDAAQAQAVFNPLYTTKADGIGLGLSIARSIIEAHGGRIWAELGGGGRFCFTLPLAS